MSTFSKEKEALLRGRMPPRLPKKQALSSSTAKRHRVPAVDLDENPFCQDRQLADELALMKLNKNPQLHAPTAAGVLGRLDRAAAATTSGAHHGEAAPPPRPFGKRSAIEAATDASGPGGFDAITTHGIIVAASASAARRDKARLHALAATRRERGGKQGQGQGGGLSAAAASARRLQRRAPKVPTFGHRPKSASRHFAPATGGRTAHQALEPSSAGVGMSLAELRNMLVGGGAAPFAGVPEPAFEDEGEEEEGEFGGGGWEVAGTGGAPMLSAPPPSTLGRGPQQQQQQSAQSAAAAAAALDDTYDPMVPKTFHLEAKDWTPEDLDASFLQTHPDVLDTLQSLEPRTAARQAAAARDLTARAAAEAGFNNTLYQSPLVRPDIVNFGPDPSEGYRHRIERFRARAAGAIMHPLCQGKQHNDALQMASGPTPLPMPAFGGNDDLSHAPPKDARQRDEAAHIKALMAKEKARQRRLEKRLREHTRMAADDRIVEQMTSKQSYVD